MPAPKTRADFYDVVRRSGLVDPARLEQIALHSDGAAEDVPQAVQELVAQGLVTTFHARQLIKGRYRGFALGKYLVLEQLGEGGMGKVFLCVHMIMRRLVAIKILSRDLASDPGTVERFQREARAVAALDHPNIVRAHDMDQEGDVHFIVMEYVDGISLHDLVRKRGPLDVSSASHYVRQAAIGLQQVMENRMIHRDIKPGNLLLDRRGTVKILDLGLARFSHEKHGSLTQKFDEGSVLGTADYLAPEQAMDSHRVDIRADIYSLGATFYFLLSGKPPFEGGSVTQKLLYHQMHNPTSLRKLRPDLPAELITVVEKMMAKDPMERFQTPNEVVYALEPWTRGPLPLPREDELPRHCLYVQKAAQGDLSTSLAALQAATSVAASGVRLAATPVGAGVAVGGSGLPEGYGGMGRTADDSAVMSNSGSSQANVRLSDASFPGRDPSTARMPPSTGNYGASANGVGPAPTTRRRKSKKGKRNLLFGLVLAGGAIAVIAVVLLLSGGSKGGRQELIVSTTETGPNVYKTLQEAWEKRDLTVTTGTINIKSEEIREQLKLKRGSKEEKGEWRIQPDPSLGNKKIKWLPPRNAAEDRPLLHLEDVPAVTLFNLEFDGEDQINDLIVVKGNFENLKFSRMDLKRPRKSAIRFIGCNTKRQSDMWSINCEAGKETEACFIFEGGEGNGMNRNLTFNSCFINGKVDNKPSKNAILVSGPMDKVLFISCTFSNVRNGFLFKGALPDPADVSVQGSTLQDMDTGFLFETLPIAPPQRGQVSIGNDTFTRVKKLALVMDGSEPFAYEPSGLALGNLQWVWTNNEGDPLKNAAPGPRYFRTTFSMEAAFGAKVMMDIACDDTCKAFLNGIPLKAANGSTEFPLAPHQRKVHSINITDFVRAGINVLAIEASSEANKKAGPRGLLVRVFNQQDRKLLAVTDEKWMWTASKPPAEWHNPDFTLSFWQPVKILGRYHDEPLRAWHNLVWESEVLSQFQKKNAQPWQIIQLLPEPSKHDPGSAEGFPNLETTQYYPQQRPTR